MRKLVSLMLCVLMIGALAIPVSAAGTCTFIITPSAAEVNAGEEVTLTVTVEQGAACTEFGVVVKYDTSLFELISCKSQGAGFPIPIDGEAAGATPAYPGVGGWAASKTSAEEPVPMVPAGTVGTVVLKAKSKVSLDATTLSGEAKAVNAGTEVAATVKIAEVQKEEILWGDANGDGRVNTRDSMKIAQYYLDRTISINLAASDVNGDGRYNTRDSMLIAQYYASGGTTKFPVQK